MSKAKEEIGLKQVGQNVMLNIKGEGFSRRIVDKEEREELKTLVAGYNKRNSKAKEKSILAIIQKGKSTEKQRVSKARKSSVTQTRKKVVEKAPVVKKSKEDEIAEAKKLLKDEGFEVSKKAPKTHVGRRREY